MTVMLVISGGQTGADQGGLIGAERIHIKTGGWAPKGYLTDEGPNVLLRERFHLWEDTSASYAPRTKKNVKRADGTVWFGNPDSPGGRLTSSQARLWAKPFIANPTALELRAWIETHQISVLNVAGNRERRNPGICQRVADLIAEALS